MALLTWPMMLVGLMLSAILIAVYNCWWKRRNLPPGPTPLPVVGNLVSLMAKPTGEDVYNGWAKRFGPIFTFWLGEQPVVMITDYKTMVDTVQKDGSSYADRFVYSAMDDLVKDGTHGVVGTSGDLWREQRRFALQVLREFGVGRNLMQEKILSVIGPTFATFDAQLSALPDPNADVSVDSVIDMVIASILSQLLFGYRFGAENMEQFHMMKNAAREIVYQYATFQQLVANRLPALVRLPYFNGPFNRLRQMYKYLKVCNLRVIDEHQAKIDKSDDLDTPSNDYVEAFLKEREKLRRAGKTDHHFTTLQLVHMCFDIWIGGQQTLTGTLAWGMAHIIHNLHTQERMHKELDAVVGDPNKLVTLDEKSKLHYVNAVVCETYRIANVISMLNAVRRTTREVTLCGYPLPRGTCVVPQIAAVHYNEEYFDEPYRFKPERYIDADGNFVKPNEVINFSIGRRQCLGESLARMSVFLFISNFFNRYKVSPGTKMPSLKREFGLSVQCPRFQCRVQRRV